MGKKIWVSYFFMKNPYMKFQNPSMHCSEVMLCTKKCNGRTHGRTDARTHARTHKSPRSNMPLQLLRSWGHNYLLSPRPIRLSMCEIWCNIHCYGHSWVDWHMQSSELCVKSWTNSLQILKPRVAILPAKTCQKKHVRKDNKIVDQKVSYIWDIQLHFWGHYILYNPTMNSQSTELYINMTR